MTRLCCLLLPGSSLLACLVLAACALSSAPAGVQVTPMPTVTAAHRGPVLVQYCADNTGIYPLEDFRRANQLVATSLVAAVGANTEGLTLYATRFASDTFDPANTLPPFLVPATPAFPALPAPLPTTTQANPVSYGATATALANQQSAAIASYNAQMVSVKTQLASCTVNLLDAQITGSR